MREFSAIAEDFTLTLASRGSRKRVGDVVEACAMCIVHCATEMNAEVLMCGIFPGAKFLQEIVRFNLGPSSFNCDAICS